MPYGIHGTYIYKVIFTFAKPHLIVTTHRERCKDVHLTTERPEHQRRELHGLFKSQSMENLGPNLVEVPLAPYPCKIKSSPMGIPRTKTLLILPFGVPRQRSLRSPDDSGSALSVHDTHTQQQTSDFVCSQSVAHHWIHCACFPVRETELRDTVLTLNVILKSVEPWKVSMHRSNIIIGKNLKINRTNNVNIREWKYCLIECSEMMEMSCVCTVHTTATGTCGSWAGEVWPIHMRLRYWICNCIWLSLICFNSYTWSVTTTPKSPKKENLRVE